MERKIKVSIESGGDNDYGIWEDILLNDGNQLQVMTFKFDMSFTLRKRSNNTIYIHANVGGNPFYIIINPADNTIEYLQAKTYHEIKIVSNIKEGLCELLMEHLTKVNDGEIRFGNFEFTDKETTTDPVGPNQTAGKRRRRKTRRHRRS